MGTGKGNNEVFSPEITNQVIAKLAKIYLIL